ncbi:hypothetical protein SAMN05192534_12376 [Alteribacillus persepolensis]|uniref:Phage protein Gp138 N-terminal domain-containing protein n=1 Tax=Alteribacillus persepolensis TaxID=568899 RepID=A0A1G8ICF1_9BACI|nr:hypothetical protein [Alteribacillus persepolensis]SDI16230.1 hypothetical protein SAMN05192534_12376 [Alteribacillus persepolensis]
MIHTNIICRVESYDTETGIGDLAPLFTDEDGQPFSKIINARAQRQRLKLPKTFTLEGGSVNHSPIPHNGTSHTINSGDMTISYDDAETQNIEIFPHYETGDIVLAAIPEFNFSDAIKGKTGNGGVKEPHNLTSAIITGLVGDMS